MGKKRDNGKEKRPLKFWVSQLNQSLWQIQLCLLHAYDFFPLNDTEKLHNNAEKFKLNVQPTTSLGFLYYMKIIFLKSLSSLSHDCFTTLLFPDISNTSPLLLLTDDFVFVLLKASSNQRKFPQVPQHFSPSCINFFITCLSFLE